MQKNIYKTLTINSDLDNNRLEIETYDNESIMLTITDPKDESKDESFEINTRQVDEIINFLKYIREGMR